MWKLTYDDLDEPNASRYDAAYVRIARFKRFKTWYAIVALKEKVNTKQQGE